MVGVGGDIHGPKPSKSIGFRWVFEVGAGDRRGTAKVSMARQYVSRSADPFSGLSYLRLDPFSELSIGNTNCNLYLVFGRFPAEVGPETRSNGSGLKNGAERNRK